MDAEYERLRAIRRRDERKYNRSGQLEHYLEAQRTHALMRRQLKKLAKKRWRSNCDSLSPFTSIPKVWNILRALRTPVTQIHSFRALALHRGISVVLVADEFCQLLTRPGAATCTIEFTTSCNAVKKKNRCTILVNSFRVGSPIHNARTGDCLTNNFR